MERALFASLLDQPRLTRMLAGGLTLHLGLVAAGLPGWHCPFAQAFGVPCPGCGLSRACLALICGEGSRALALHAFAPAAVLGAAVLLGAALLGARGRTWLAGWVRRIEERTGITLWLLGGLLIYWGSRFFLDGANFLPLGR